MIVSPQIPFIERIKIAPRSFFYLDVGSVTCPLTLSCDKIYAICYDSGTCPLTLYDSLPRIAI